MVIAMTAESRKAKDIFLELLANVAPDQWDDRLKMICQGDDPLRNHVRALLRAHIEPGSFLEQPAIAGDATMHHELPILEQPGAVIGPYKLLQQIGEGGMGVVFMAEQTEPLQRTVALKIIKPGMDTRQVVARFEAERQALALMDHPNIAKVLDAGTTDTGRPYFVMELVKGVPITKYCDEKHLPLRARLELFVQVCQAVQHAHQKGIIHRDIKPNNVLVADYDNQAVPKVIDFGVAKATAQKLTERTMFTEFGQLIGTMEYMSPEQSKFNQLDIDTRSDIYSLGVLLYELLAGSTPFEGKRLHAAAFDEMLRIIREEEPPRPSTRVSSSDTLPSIAANRHTEPARLSKDVRGDLDWIAMKCLEKDRNRRYETASALAMDIQQFLDDEPVLARPPSTMYRFRKFARRNRAALTTATLTLLGVLVIAGIAGWALNDRHIQHAAVATRAEQALNESESLYRQRNLPAAAQLARNALAQVEGLAGAQAVERRARKWIKDVNMVATLEEIHTRQGEDWGALAGKSTEVNRAFREYGIDIEALAPAEAAARITARPIHVDLAVSLDRWANYMHTSARVSSEKEVALCDRLRQVARLADADPLRNRLRDPVRMEYAELQKIAATVDLATTPIATLMLIGDALDWPEERTEFYARLQQHHRNDFGINVALGRMLHLDRDPNRAVRYLTAAVAIRPESASAHRDLGHALGRASRIVIDYYMWDDPRRELKNALLRKRLVDEATAELREVARLDPSDTNIQLQLAAQLLSSGREEEAAAAYRDLLPRDTSVRLYIADQYGRLDMKVKALAAYRNAVRLEPENADAHTKLGTELAVQGLLDEAIAAHREAVRLNPKNSDAQLNLGDELKGKGLLDQASAAYREMFRLTPTSIYASRSSEILDEPRLLDQVIADYRDAVRSEPGSAAVHANLGFALVKKDRLDEAAASYREAVRLRPADGALQYQFGNACARCGTWHEAQSAFEAAMISPDYPNWCAGSPLCLATLYFHTNDQKHYRRVCHMILDKYGQTVNIPSAGAAAMPCALAPGFGGDERLVIRLANIALDADHVKATLAMGGKLQDPDGYKRYEITKGLVDYRVGSFAAAAEIILHTAPSADGTHRDALAFSILAMAQLRLGKLDESRTSFANAQRIIETKMPKVETGETFGGDWQDWLHAQIICREAEEMLKIRDENPTTKPESK